MANLSTSTVRAFSTVVGPPWLPACAVPSSPTPPEPCYAGNPTREGPPVFPSFLRNVMPRPVFGAAAFRSSVFLRVHASERFIRISSVLPASCARVSPCWPAIVALWCGPCREQSARPPPPPQPTPLPFILFTGAAQGRSRARYSGDSAASDDRPSERSSRADRLAEHDQSSSIDRVAVPGSGPVPGPGSGPGPGQPGAGRQGTAGPRGDCYGTRVGWSYPDRPARAAHEGALNALPEDGNGLRPVAKPGLEPVGEMWGGHDSGIRTGHGHET